MMDTSIRPDSTSASALGSPEPPTDRVVRLALDLGRARRRIDRLEIAAHAYSGLLDKLIEGVTHIHMDTEEDRELHDRFIQTFRDSAEKVRAYLDAPPRSDD